MHPIAAVEQVSPPEARTISSSPPPSSATGDPLSDVIGKRVTVPAR